MTFVKKAQYIILITVNHANTQTCANSKGTLTLASMTFMRKMKNYKCDTRLNLYYLDWNRSF